MTGPLTPLPIIAPNEFDRYAARAAGRRLTGSSVQTVQVNIGLRCNLACHHCHVESSPKRTEEMDWPTMQLVLAAARTAGAGSLDVTGRSEEHTSELQSRQYIVCRLLLEKKRGGITGSIGRSCRPPAGGLVVRRRGRLGRRTGVRGGRGDSRGLVWWQCRVRLALRFYRRA